MTTTKQHSPAKQAGEGTKGDATLSATREGLLALLRKLVSAESGSRELDANIVMVGAAPRDGKVTPRYTANTDAALILVPTGWGAELWVDAYRSEAGANCLRLMFPEDDTSANAPTLPLALCIAALRARLVMVEDQSHDG